MSLRAAHAIYSKQQAKSPGRGDAGSSLQEAWGEPNGGKEQWGLQALLGQQYRTSVSPRDGEPSTPTSPAGGKPGAGFRSRRFSSTPNKGDEASPSPDAGYQQQQQQGSGVRKPSSTGGALQPTLQQRLSSTYQSGSGRPSTSPAASLLGGLQGTTQLGGVFSYKALRPKSSGTGGGALTGMGGVKGSGMKTSQGQDNGEHAMHVFDTACTLASHLSFKASSPDIALASWAYFISQWQWLGCSLYGYLPAHEPCTALNGCRIRAVSELSACVTHTLQPLSPHSSQLIRCLLK